MNSIDSLKVIRAKVNKYVADVLNGRKPEGIEAIANKSRIKDKELIAVLEYDSMEDAEERLLRIYEFLLDDLMIENKTLDIN